MVSENETSGLLLEIVDGAEGLETGNTHSVLVSELDHVATVVPDLDGALVAFQHLRFNEDPSSSGWQFPDLSTRNIVMPADWGYLELNQALTSDGVFGSVAAARGAGIVGLTLTVHDLPAAVERLREADVGITDPASVVARSPDGAELDLGHSAVVSMKHAFGTRLFLFAPTAEAPYFGPKERRGAGPSEFGVRQRSTS
jgi:hypothetical protein